MTNPTPPLSEAAIAVGEAASVALIGDELCPGGSYEIAAAALRAVADQGQPDSNNELVVPVDTILAIAAEL